MILKNKFVWPALLMIPIVIFFYQYLFTGNKLIGGDFDYYAQLYEAFRISVVKFGQFPLWNPWMSGGLPLFANPQFGLFSIQSVLTLIFGTVYGLKLAYVLYAVAGFWGMYTIGRSILKASTLRSVLVAYIWVFCGFFSFHGMSHFTFALFYLLPWQIYFIFNRKKKWSWVYLGVLQALIINSSVHYALLMTAVAIALFFIFSILTVKYSSKKVAITLNILKSDVMFVLKTCIIAFILSAYRLVTTMQFIAGNERVINIPEKNPTVSIILQSLFSPVDTFFKVPANLQYGWGEYSMYLGVGVVLILLFCLFRLFVYLYKKKKLPEIPLRTFLLPVILLGLVGVLFALGEFSKYSPYNILRELPGFTQTRVPSRWLIMTVFAILVYIMTLRKHTNIINVLLLAAVIELFLTFGPPRITGYNQTDLPKTKFSKDFTQYDSARRHHDYQSVIKHSYFYSTSRNIGLIYADDSIVNTLNAVVGTSRCGFNLNPECDLVLSDNADVTYWSPNKVILNRTAGGAINLNMNPEKGWSVNNSYIFNNQTSLDPARKFNVPSDGQDSYIIEYKPRFSPSWLLYKLTD